MLYVITDKKRIYLGSTLIADNTEDASGKAVESVAFDSNAYKITFTYTDGTKQEVDLPVESVLSAVSYNGATHKLTITLVSGSTSEINLADLVDVYTVVSSDTVEMAITAGAISADVKVSAETGNRLEVKQDGLYVPEPDLTIGAF